MKLVLLILTMLPAVAAENTTPQRHLLVYGDSLSAGYGLGKERAFPALLPALAGAHGLKLEVTNAGVSGDTTSGGLRRLDWSLRKKVDVFLLELGANDGLRGVSPALIEQNLQAIIDRVTEKFPDVIIVLAGMTLPPNLGETYIHAFEAMFQKLANRNKLHLIPFILEGVAGEPKLNLADGIHPTEEGHQIIAQLVMKHLLQALARNAEE